MTLLAGPRMYYSLFGPLGVFLGAKARVLRRSIQVVVEIAGVRHPVHLRMRTTDVWLCRQILIDEQYEYGCSTQLRVIVDAGANIGLASIFYANRYPEAKIIAIEPERSNYELLRKNVELYSNVIPIRAALWSKKMNLYGSGNLASHHAYQVTEANGSSDAHSETIAGLSLEDLIAEFGVEQIDLLKVDIEGSEKEVFRDSTSWIERVGTIAIELHDWIQSGSSEIVHNSAQGFAVRWKQGETNYFARTRCTPDFQARTQPNLILPSRAGLNRTAAFPMKIIEVI